MKIILTHGYFLQEDPKEQQIMRPYPPLGILYISAFLEKNGFQNTVFDSTFSSLQDLFSQLEMEMPALLGIYTNLMTKVNVLKIISFVRSNPILKETTIVLGGPEVRHHKDKFLNAGAHIIVLGEGEESMLEVAEAIKNKKEFSGISGIAWKKNSEIIENPARDLLKNIDLLPFPARDQIDLAKYRDAWKNRHGYSMLSVSTMRGCPYTCKWCSRAVYGQSYRRRSPALVVAEIKEIMQNHTPDKIWFVDDVFTINHKWLRGFNEELEKQQVKIRYECITRADRMNDEVIELLRSSGCDTVWIGAESGSQKIIDAMDRRVKVEEVGNMIRSSKKAGIKAGTFIMLGYPGETLDDIEETVKHLKRCDPDQFTITLTYPITGTPLFEEVSTDIIVQPEWESSSDRDIDFRRNYSRAFYDHAVRYVYNEWALNKARLQKKSLLSKGKLKVKSLISRTGMFLYSTGK